MPDITVTWDPINQRGDWSVANGDLVTGSDLETSVLICLFTDRVLPSDTVPPDGTDDHRGWAGDSYAEMPIGSRLWTLRRRSISNVSALLRDATDICNEALASIISDGVASSINVQCYYLAPGQLGITVTITEPDGNVLPPFQFQWAWNGVFS